VPPFSPGKHLVVLGAGASRGARFNDAFQPSCDPPLNADFFTQLQRITDAKYTDLVRAVIDDVVRLFGAPFSLTLEDYFTQLEFLLETMRYAPSAAGSISASDLREKRGRLLHAVSAVIEMSTDAAIRGSEGCEHHQRLVEQLQEKDTVISFNYDCVMDHALRKHGSGKWSATYGYTFPNPARIVGTDAWDPPMPARSAQSISLLKLHGSLNWQLPDEVEADGPSGEIKLKQRLHGQRGVPYFTIIPPVWNKGIRESPAFETLWKNAERAIRNAEHIAIAGFSFAATDLPVESLFRVALLPPEELRSRDRSVESGVRVGRRFSRGVLASWSWSG
jgi:hypothetical protein